MSEAVEEAAEGEPPPLPVVLLWTLSQEQTERAESQIPLTRIAKKTGLGVSVILREFTQLSDAVLGGTPGPGLVHVEQQDGRWLVGLTRTGHEVLAGLRPA